MPVGPPLENGTQRSVSLIQLFRKGRLFEKPRDFRSREHAAFVLVKRARERYRQGDRLGALGDFDRAIAVDPGCVAAYVGRGNAHFHYENVPAAVADYEQAIRLNPDYAPAYYNRACACACQGEISGAIEYLRSAIKRDGRFRDYAKTDVDFDSIREHPELKLLFGIQSDI